MTRVYIWVWPTHKVQNEFGKNNFATKKPNIIEATLRASISRDDDTYFITEWPTMPQLFDAYLSNFSFNNSKLGTDEYQIVMRK